MITLEVFVDYRSRGATAITRGQAEFFEVNRRSVQRIGRAAREAAKRLSPKKSEKFSGSWQFRTRDRGNGDVELSLQNTDPKAEFVLFDTKPHFIFPTNAKFLRFAPSEGADFIFTKMVNHPGTKGQNIFEEVQEDGDFIGDAERILEDETSLFARRL